MAVELSASRLMAPYFGTSTFVWTNIIGIIMAALSAGYVLGGKLADKKPSLPVLLKLLALACAWLMAIPFVAPHMIRGLISLMKHVNSSFTFIFFGSLSAIALLFSSPILVMGMTGPFLIRIVAKHDELGNSAGRIFGISTLGSIAGTFLPILVFIPFFGTARTILFFSMLLLCITAAGFSSRLNIGISLLSIGLFTIPVPPARNQPGLVYSTESEYQYIEVIDKEPCRYLSYNDMSGFQTIACKYSPLTGHYFDFYSLLPYFVEKPVGNVALLGLGGGIIANQIHYFHPGIKIDAVEIDPKVISIAKKYFRLTDRADVYNQDGRIFLNLNNTKYDVIIIDAFTQQLYIPFHMATDDFFGQAKQKLNSRGLIAMNVPAYSDDSQLLNSITNTLHKNFRNVYKIRIHQTFSNLIIASDIDIDFQNLSAAFGTALDGIATESVSTFKKIDYDPRFGELTDDKAPIEFMVDWEILSSMKGK